MLSPRIVSGVHCADDVQVSNRRYVEALEAAARAQGADIRTGVEVQRLIYEDDKVLGVETTQDEKIYAEMTVVAAGAWSHALQIPARVPLHIRPVKGQMMALQMDPKAPLLRHRSEEHTSELQSRGH